MPSKRRPQARRHRKPEAVRNKSTNINVRRPGQRVKARPVSRTPRYSSLTSREKATRERSLNLLSDLRHRKGSYSRLLREHHLDTRSAHKYLGPNLIGGTGGRRVRASKADRLVRELMFPMSFGDRPVRTRSSRQATKLSEFFQDRDKLLRGKLSADAFEAKWHGVRVAGQELFTDTVAIFRMANADELKVENLYASTGSAR